MNKCEKFLVFGILQVHTSLCISDVSSFTKIFLQCILADEEQLERFKEKYAYLSEFYKLMEAIRGQNHTFSLGWKCNTCEAGKIIRSHSSSATSNLKKHISKCHPETLSSFLMLRDCNKISIPSNTVFIEKC